MSKHTAGFLAKHMNCCLLYGSYLPAWWHREQPDVVVTSKTFAEAHAGCPLFKQLSTCRQAWRRKAWWVWWEIYIDDGMGWPCTPESNSTRIWESGGSTLHSFQTHNWEWELNSQLNLWPLFQVKRLRIKTPDATKTLIEGRFFATCKRRTAKQCSDTASNQGPHEISEDRKELRNK